MIKGVGNRFAFEYGNAANPANTTYGLSVVPGASNAEGSWTQIASAANIASDIYGFWLMVSGGSTTGAAKNHLIDIGVDPAGGTSYTAIISNLVCGQSATLDDAGRSWYFPMFIKSGSSVAVRVQGSNATAGTVRVAMDFYGKPSRPEAIQAGVFSETIGAITNSNGVSFTPGNTGTEGSWVSLGTTAKNLWWWQLGVQVDNATLTNLAYYIDLAYGDATNKHMIIENHFFEIVSGNERAMSLLDRNCHCEVPAGSTIYVRGTCSGTAESGFNAVAVGVGG